MISSLAHAYPFVPDIQSPPAGTTAGAHRLLSPKAERSSSYSVQAIAVLTYALALVAVMTLTFHQADPVLEEPLELVMLPAEPEAPAIEEPPPSPIEEEIEPEPPPPPVAEEPEPVAPVESTPPIPEKKPIPVKKKRAEKPPVQRPQRAAVSAPGSARQAAPSAKAVPSGYANQIFARVSRTASTGPARAEIARGQKGRISYRLVIGPGGNLISKSITPSGNPIFDRAATDALARAAPFPPTGVARAISLSGAIVYR